MIISSSDSEVVFDIQERTFLFSVKLIKVTTGLNLDNKFSPLINQVLRSGTSIGANVVEGRGGNSKKEMRRYYRIAYRSANETKYWLRLINEAIYKSDEFNGLIKEATEISKILGSSISKLNDESRDNLKEK